VPDTAVRTAVVPEPADGQSADRSGSLHLLLSSYLTPTKLGAIGPLGRSPEAALSHRLIDPEHVDIWTSERQTRQALRHCPLRPMPLVVLAHGRPEDPDAPFVAQDERLWRQLQRELAHLVPGGRLRLDPEPRRDTQQVREPEEQLAAVGRG